MTSDRRRGGGAGLLAKLLLVAFSLGLVVLTVEAAFRIAPRMLPKGSYGAGRYDPDLRANLHDGPVIYNKVRFVRRVPNAAGFMDVEHALAAAPGTTRIGFFGDSYVQSVQVPLEQVFFRLLDERLRPGFEALGFGVSGWGTFHAMRAWEVYGRRYGIDRPVYVFVENDPGDQLASVANPSGAVHYGMPFLRPDGPTGYRVVWPVPPEQAPLSFRLAKAVQRHSLLAHLVRSRVVAIATAGVGTGARDADVEMAGRAGKLPNSNDLPSTWPAAYAREARDLGRRVLADWAERVRADGRTLTVLYVPRGEAQLRGEITQDQTWLPWLEQTCAELAIPLVDPSDALRARLARGDAVYSDHWSPAGHEVIAEVLAASALTRP